MLSVLTRHAERFKNTAKFAGNKDFLEGLCAAAALVSMADGTASDDEVKKASEIIKGHKLVTGAGFKPSDIDKTIDAMFSRAKSVTGKVGLVRELEDVKKRCDASGDETQVEDLYLIAMDVAGASGDIDDKEKKVLDKIASVLGVDAKKFDF